LRTSSNLAIVIHSLLYSPTRLLCCIAVILRGKYRLVFPQQALIDEKSLKSKDSHFCCVKNNVIIHENVVEILCVPTLRNLPQQVSSFWPTQGITIDVFDVTWEDSFYLNYRNVTITFIKIAKWFPEKNRQATLCLYHVKNLGTAGLQSLASPLYLNRSFIYTNRSMTFSSTTHTSVFRQLII